VSLAKEGVPKLMIADLSIDAAKETQSECQAVATHPQFEGRVSSTDVTKEESVISLFQQTADAFGRIDYCVNSAGVSV
jgi:NAD(P)-dependent dehydrogenase (short-subunit alcohol dehydrogenase family)